MIAWIACFAAASTWDVVRGARVAEVTPPADAARAAYVALVGDLVREAPRGALSPALDDRARALGFALRRGEPDVVWLVELTPTGAGVLALRLGPLAGSLVLQAPHPVTDLHTGAITAALFDAGGVRAACIATTRRDEGEGADPAHTPASYFQSTTDALADALLDPLFVQIHGFGDGTAEVDLVLSDGAARGPRADLEPLARRMAAALDGATWALGDDVPALAARHNAQGMLLRGRARFVHLELAVRPRETLKRDDAARARFGATLQDLAARGPG